MDVGAGPVREPARGPRPTGSRRTTGLAGALERLEELVGSPDQKLPDLELPLPR
jgi:hypothetical protein